MAEKEMLQLIISTLKSIDEKVNSIEAEQKKTNVRLATLEAEQKKTNIRLDTLESKVDVLETRINALENAQAKSVVTLDALEADVTKLQVTMENTVDRCIQVLYEAHTLNADRFDKINFDNLDHNYKLSAMTAKLAYDGMQELTKRFDEFIKTA